MTSVNAQHEALLDELLKDYTDPKDILGEHGLLKQLTKRVVERVLEAELTAHLGYAPYGRYGTEDQNARNGKSHKTVQTDTGPLHLEVPRDRKGRILLANLEISFHCTTTDSCVDATTVNIRVEQRACRLVQTFAMEHFSGNVLQEIFM
jgi:hypothetical protein